MTATQAPTPGPLTADQKAVEAMQGAIAWDKERGYRMPYRVRDPLYAAVDALTSLAPPAPDEASGSERDDPDFWCRLMGEALDALDIIASDEPWSDGATSAVFAEKASATIRAKYSDLSSEPHDERRGGYDRSDVRYGLQLIADEECDEVAAAYYAKKALAALRPQPSGETREEIIKILQRGMVSARSRMHGGGHSVIGLDMAATGQVFDDWDDANEALAGIRADAILALRPAPVASGGQHSSGEDAAWSWLNRHVECDPADRDYSADEMVDAFMAGAGRYDIWLKALERIAGEQQHRSGYCQTDITVEPALTAEEAQTVARDALSTTPARAEAQDEGAAGEPVSWRYRWKPTPRSQPGDWREPTNVRWPEDERVGYEEQALYDHPSPTPAADEDRVRIAVEALEPFGLLAPSEVSNGVNMADPLSKWFTVAQLERAASAIEALKSTAAKEGEEL